MAMSIKAATVPSEQVAVHRFRLAGVLAVIGIVAFTTALIAFSGNLTPYWLLYLLPVVVGALAYDVPGAIVAVGISALACAAVTPRGLLGNSWPELLAGAIVFLLCGIVVGLQARRQRDHAAALERASALDAVTGVMTTGPFTERLAEEVQRAERYRTSLGVVVVRVEDLEGFERVFGHYKLDLMLRHLANVLALAARGSDIVGRLGKSEFAIILPGANIDGARTVAERVQRLCATTSFEGDALEPVTTCPAAAGPASYPGEAGTAAALLELAASRSVTSTPADADASGECEVTPCDV